MNENELGEHVEQLWARGVEMYRDNPTPYLAGVCDGLLAVLTQMGRAR